ncbi:zf-CCHC domain-containing protein [Tanacetum coccineum]
MFVQQYEQFLISDDEAIDCLFARFNTIITSLKALDESFSSRNQVTKFLRVLPLNWRPKNSEASKNKKEKFKSLALKAKKVSSDEEASSSDIEDEEYAMAVRDFKNFFKTRGKFVQQLHDDKKAFRKVKEDKKGKVDRKCFKCGVFQVWRISSVACFKCGDPNHYISDCPKLSYNDQKAFVGGE